VATSINGNNITWRDDKTGELVTDPHNDLELMMKKNRKITKRKKQGGGDLRLRGRVNRGSGKSDPTSPINTATNQRYSVDDVPAVLGKDEFVVNSQAAKAVGYEFLDKINNIGTNKSNQFKRGDLTSHGSNYQKGGKVRRQRGGRGRVRRQMGNKSSCGPNQHWMPPVNGQPGYCMQGKTHSGGMSGRGRKGYQAGGRGGTHKHPHHYHSAYNAPDGQGIMGVSGPSLTGWDDNWTDDSHPDSSGETHKHPQHYHSKYNPPDGQGIMGVSGPSLTGWDDNWTDDSLGDHSHGGEQEAAGCMDPNCFNYNQNATIPGSCYGCCPDPPCGFTPDPSPGKGPPQKPHGMLKAIKGGRIRKSPVKRQSPYGRAKLSRPRKRRQPSPAGRRLKVSGMQHPRPWGGK